MSNKKLVCVQFTGREDRTYDNIEVVTWDDEFLILKGEGKLITIRSCFVFSTVEQPHE